MPSRLPPRWRVLALWWATHALVGGSARIIFEAHLPSLIRSRAWGLSREELPALLQAGTVVTIAAKLSAGLVITRLSPYFVGVLSLLLCGMSVGGVGYGAFDFITTASSSPPLLTIFMAWNLMRWFQSYTWPATNLLLEAWFPASEHGRAWGVMSTASRSGILCTTGILSLVGADTDEKIKRNFAGMGILLIACGLLLSVLLPRHDPAVVAAAADPPSAANNTAAGKNKGTGSLAALFACTIFLPTFYFALLAQMAIGPIAEFQSQLPLWLAGQNVTTATTCPVTTAQISLGVNAWHCGVLLSVLVAGALFDKWPRAWQRGVVLVVPLAINAALFRRAGNVSANEQWPVAWMIAAAFTLGFTFAPVNYLSASTWTMTHVPRTFMPTASAIVDLGGYVGTIVLLQLQSSSGVEENEKTLFLMRLLSVSASCCCLFLVGRFALEELHGAGRHPHGEGKKDA